MSAAPRVIKLGGSLLDWPPLAAELRRWLERQPPARANIIVAGGGTIVDALRELDRAGGLAAETTHWLAIRAMGLTAALVAELLAVPPPVRNLADLRLDGEATPQVFEPGDFLRADASHPDALPIGWQVTSDSIAARLAVHLAAELVLLKSALPVSTDRRQLAAAGYVDPFFPQASAGLATRCVNLRDAQFGELWLV